MELAPARLEVNNVRLPLLGTRTLFQWIPEPFIRVLNQSPASSYAKVYDGIARLLLNGESVDFAIEYERTLKSQPKYEKIREAIESKKRLHCFLYLARHMTSFSTLCTNSGGQRDLFSLGSAANSTRMCLTRPYGPRTTTARFFEKRC